MFEFIRKSPLGFVLTAAAVVLALSPEAREATRKAAVKGTAVIMDLVDKAKDASYVPKPNLIEDSSHFTEVSEMNVVAENGDSTS